jgi:hypothetical protein
LIALTANAAEHAEFLKNHRPGNDGESSEQGQNATGDRASLRKNVTKIGDKYSGEQKNVATPQ